MNKQELEGLQGWLLLVGAGVIVGPVLMLYEMISMYGDLLEQGFLLALITPDSGYYKPLLGGLIMVEMIVNVVILLASLYLIYLFFSKHYLFPRYYIYILLLSITFQFVSAWLSSEFIPNQVMFDERTGMEFIRSVIAGLIWIPYMLYSERVEVTFTRKKQADEESN